MIKLKKSKQPFYKFIHILALIDLKTLKTHIQANKANSFIKLSKLLESVLVYFVQKADNNFFCILIIKNSIILKLKIDICFS